MRIPFKQIALAGMLACLGASAFAVNYFYVTPKSGEMAKVAPFTVALGQTTLPGAVVGLPYNSGAGYNLAPLATVSGDPALNKALVTFALTTGSLPAGLVLSAAGLISGTPTAAGSNAIQVTASYKAANGAQAYAIVSVNLVVVLASATLPAAKVGLPYNNGSGFDFATGLSAPADSAFNAGLATFSLTSNNLPAGMALSPSGKLTGTPTAASASTSLQVAATYKSNTASQNYTWVATNVGHLASCAQILAATPGTADGIQTIDPDGAGPLPAMVVSCDMSTHGGGWTMVAGISSVTTAHHSPASVAWSGTVGSKAELGKLADAVINLLKGSSGSTTIAYRLTSGSITSFFPGSCIFVANGNVSGDCTKFTNTYAQSPTWTIGAVSNDGCPPPTYYGGLSSYIHAVCNGNAGNTGSGNLIYSRPSGNSVQPGLVRGPSYTMGVAGTLWVR